MSSTKSKTASDGSKTNCSECGNEVRGLKGLAAHEKVCAGPQKAEGKQ